jgi:hypothetical protein
MPPSRSLSLSPSCGELDASASPTAYLTASHTAAGISTKFVSVWDIMGSTVYETAIATDVPLSFLQQMTSQINRYRTDASGTKPSLVQEMIIVYESDNSQAEPYGNTLYAKAFSVRPGNPRSEEPCWRPADDRSGHPSLLGC